MVGATLGYASAAMPEKEFFVKDGEPNVKIVVGANAPSTMDVVSAADIAVALGTLLYTEKEVEAEATAVVVKEDTAYDPDDIPVFDNTYDETTNTYDEMTYYWWNGSWEDCDSDEDYCDIEFNWTDENMGLWEDNDDDGTPEVTWDEVNAASPDYNPLTFKVKNALTWELGTPYKDEITVDGEDVSIEVTEEALAYTVNITEIMFDPDDWEDFTSDDDYVEDLVPKSIDLVIPDGGITYTVDYKVGYGIVDWYNTPAGMPYAFYLIGDDYTWSGVFLDAAYPGDTIELFGKELKLVDVDANGTVLGSNYVVVVGEAYDPEYMRVGETYTFGDYKVTPVDIDVYDDKALLQVEGPEGSELVILDVDTDPEEILFDGGIMVELQDTFVGIEGNLIALVEVSTNLEGYEETVEDFFDGWDLTFVLTPEGDGIDKITLTNNEDLKGSKINLFNAFEVYYDYTEYTDEKDSDKYYGAEAWVVIDPIEEEWEYDEVEIGDELDDYVIDGVVTEPVKTIEITKVTEPITVLDDEVDLNAVDSNLILVGGPVANAITKYLVDQGLSTVDWENSDGEFEYLEDVFGEYDVLIVAGKDRYATREAAKELMQYLAAL